MSRGLAPNPTELPFPAKGIMMLNNKCGGGLRASLYARQTMPPGPFASIKKNSINAQGFFPVR
jgi:hypothetical protein